MQEGMELRKALHELNNVFTVVVSSSELILFDLEPGHASIHDIKAILAACERGRLIIESLRENPK